MKKVFFLLKNPYRDLVYTNDHVRTSPNKKERMDWSHTIRMINLCVLVLF